MGYGDLQFFDIIIFAGIAAFLIYRLRKTLGKRNGFEKNVVEKYPITEKTGTPKKETPDLKDGEKKLSAVYEVMPTFDHKNFLEGAKFAFETIINAFNKGDKKTLKTLLAEEVYMSFEKAIDSDNNNPTFQFYSLVIDGVEEVVIENNDVNITLKIISEQFKDNDESTVLKKQDMWTFQQNIGSKSSIWLLSST